MIAFTVWGEARPAGSKRAFPHPTTGKIIVTDSSGKAGKDWRRAVADAAAEAAPDEVLVGPVAVTMTFYRRRPKSHHRTGANAHLLRDSAPPFPTTRPDVLKLARACEDAMTGIVYADDAQIVRQHLHKRYDQRPRAEVVVEALDEVGDEAEVVPLREAA